MNRTRDEIRALAIKTLESCLRNNANDAYQDCMGLGLAEDHLGQQYEAYLGVAFPRETFYNDPNRISGQLCLMITMCQCIIDGKPYAPPVSAAP